MFGPMDRGTTSGTSGPRGLKNVKRCCCFQSRLICLSKPGLTLLPVVFFARPLINFPLVFRQTSPVFLHENATLLKSDHSDGKQLMK